MDALGDHAKGAEPNPPTADEVVAHRLAGTAALPDGKRHVATADALEAFRRASYRPERATLIVCGNFDVAAMQKEIETLFGDWSSGGGGSAAPSAPRVGTAVGIEARDAATVDFAIAFAPAKPFADPAARAVLAELVNARMRVLRERLGASYGVYVASSKRALSIDGAVEPAYAAQAFKAIATELARLRSNDQALADELAQAKNHVLARAMAMPAASSERATMIERVVIKGDPEPQAIRAVDMATVQQLAASAIQPGRMISAVRGDKKAIAASLEALGVEKAKVEWIEDKQQPGGHELRPGETPKVAGLTR
jgi:zinc protease